MNEGKIWTVVKPTVGVPLFLGAVALMSFTIHFALLNNTTWVKAFFEGGHKGAVAAATAPAPVETAPAAATPTAAAPATPAP